MVKIILISGLQKWRKMSEEYEDNFRVNVFRDKETLNVTKEIWYHADGKMGRVGGPAFQEFNRVNGMKVKEVYYSGDMVHRPEKDGPASRKWDAETGNLIYEEYAQYGKTNRSDGKPACISYDKNTGQIRETEFFKNDEEINPVTGNPIWEPH